MAFNKKKELFYVVTLDSSNRIIKDILISEGTLSASLVHPREVYKKAVIESAAGIIALHNHPSGAAEPSKEDIRITNNLIEAGKVMEIPLHDHIIIAGDSYFSFAENNMLKMDK